jgi:hypothetical protein
MAVPQDAAFWRRFSLAAHQDLEAQQPAGSKSSPSSQSTAPAPNEPHKASSWLATTRIKKRHSYARICCGFWLLLVFLIAVLVGIGWVLVKTGVVGKIQGGIDHVGVAVGDKVGEVRWGWLYRMFGQKQDSGG